VTNFPQLFKGIFTVIYGLLTFTFVALVAYAATAGAFGNHTDSAGTIEASECTARIGLIHDELIANGSLHLRPYQQDRVANWNASEQKRSQALDALKRGCARLDFRQQVQAIRQLQQAYTNAIRGFDARGRDAVLRLQSTHGKTQGK
jgi:hypothetical protein